MSSGQKQNTMHVDQDAEDSRQEEEEGDEDAESGTSGAPGRGYNDIDTGTEESKSTEQTSQPGKTAAKVIMMLLSDPKRVFNPEMSILQWKSKFRDAWGQYKPVATQGGCAESCNL